MTRGLVITAATVLLVAKGISLVYIRLGTAESVRPVLLLFPALYVAAAAWLWLQPQLARWVVGAFSLYAACREASVFLQGTAWDIMRRSVSLPVAAWFAYAMLLGRGVPKNPSRSPVTP